MRVLMISGNRENTEIRVPALGLACVAAAAQHAGHDTHMLDLMTAEDPQTVIQKAIEQFNPEVIGISARNIDDQRMKDTRFLLDQTRETVEWCRKYSRAPVVLGGAGFSILPGPVLKYTGGDIGIQGEGEILFPELLKRLKAKESLDSLPGVWMEGRPSPARRSYSKELDSFPLPDPSLISRSLAGAKDAPVPVQTRRGCPLTCSYCSTPTIEGKTVRWRSPEAVVEWLSRWVEEGFNSFYFVDNTFNLPPSYAHHLCSRIASSDLHISWRCILFPGRLDEKLVERLANAGCKEVSLGFESGAAGILRQMHKEFTLAEVRRAAETLRGHGIRMIGFLLLGGPGETRESAKESLAFAESLDLDAVKLSVGIRIYPNTDVARIAVREWLISAEDDLLFPRFYVGKELEEWLQSAAAEHAFRHPNWSL